MKKARTEIKFFNDDEAHVILHAADGSLTFEEQAQSLTDGLQEILNNQKNRNSAGLIPVFARFFVSDAANQMQALGKSVEALGQTPVSVVEQPPLDGTKVALWAWLMTAEESKRHHFTTGLTQDSCESNSYDQTFRLLSDYAKDLSEKGMTLAGNSIRTWFFVQNVDVNYAGLVKARNDVFANEGLTRDTHFIASTGIGGRTADWRVKVLMDTYAVEGVKAEDITYLKAADHLSPTAEYGVAFERGTMVDYGNCRRVFISGTASIDHRGQILHPCDIRLQTERMMENVSALLAEASFREEDIMQIIIYLRDISDRHTVEQIISRRYPGIPKVFTYARVCRPGWLVEMECMAAKGK